MSFGQLGDLAVECGQVETQLPQPPRRPNALFEAFDLVGECGDGRLICWSMRCCHGQCVTAEQWRATPA
jgi:hypothetical protein